MEDGLKIQFKFYLILIYKMCHFSHTCAHVRVHTPTYTQTWPKNTIQILLDFGLKDVPLHTNTHISEHYALVL